MEARDDALTKTRVVIETFLLWIGILQADCEVMQTEMDYVQQVYELGFDMPSAECLQLHRSLHRVPWVAQSVGVEATVVLEGYDERDPIRSTVLDRFCNRASIRLSQI